MLSTAAALLGGVGLFLLGMILMAEGLKAAAGASLQRVLERATGTRLRAFASGAGLTALVQSSSATTLATIGFVSAGLMTFPAAFGVIVGANVGTTSTGWIVSLLGLKFSVGAAALPLIGVGALLKLLTRGRGAHVGMALAGFGLLFVGIETLRVAMGGVAASLDLGAVSGETLGGRLLLVGMGAVMTVLLQSSSAAVALSLTAVHEGAITLDQTAFLVIGQNLGTTVTAALAALGATAPARRTAAAHIAFNGLAAVVGFVLVGPLLTGVAAFAGWLGTSDPAVLVTLFHTAFNLLGALLVLPALGPLARRIERLVPERRSPLVRHLDPSLYGVPNVAVEAAHRTLRTLAERIFALAEARLGGAPPADAHDLRDALAATLDFLGALPMPHDDRALYAERLRALHAGDHLGRLLRALAMPSPSLPVPAAADALTGDLGPEHAARLADASAALAEERRQHRAAILRDTASGTLTPAVAGARLEAMRLADRLLYHAWRAAAHLADAAEHDPFHPDHTEAP